MGRPRRHLPRQFRVPHLHGQILSKALQAYTNPARPEDSAIDPDLPSEVRNGLAFTNLLEAIPADWLPRHGGVGATVVVTMTLEQLLADLDAAGVCTLDTGGRISAAEARRLACGAGIIPMVLDGKSQPLDVGRKKRFHTEAMRLAMGIRDRGCTAEGCDKPASMCHAHHDIPYSQGGAHQRRHRPALVRAPPPPHPPPQRQRQLPPTDVSPSARHLHGLDTQHLQVPMSLPRHAGTSTLRSRTRSVLQCTGGWGATYDARSIFAASTTMSSHRRSMLFRRLVILVSLLVVAASVWNFHDHWIGPSSSTKAATAPGSQHARAERVDTAPQTLVDPPSSITTHSGVDRDRPAPPAGPSPRTPAEQR